MSLVTVKRTILSGALLGAVLFACSGGSKPPATSSSGGSETGGDASLPPPSTPTTDTSSTDAGTPPPVASSADAGSSATPPAPKGDEDECVPVAIDFEKRARPKMKESYREGKKKDADLKGTVKIKITIDMKGKIKATKVIEKTLPDPVANCMLKAVQGTPFPEVEKCWDRTLTIPITFPTPP